MIAEVNCVFLYPRVTCIVNFLLFSQHNVLLKVMQKCSFLGGRSGVAKKSLLLGYGTASVGK